jgi:peptidoglycan/LPS O-acetylase OafA/YrhL
MSETSILRGRMPELDMLRGAAIWFVVAYHATYYTFRDEGFQGLQKFLMNSTRLAWMSPNFFFVLSGFLITGILLEAKSKPVFYKTFYVRRALRILPACYVLLLILAFQRGQNPWYLVLSFFYMANMAPLLGIHITYSMLWSLAAEEHFYFVWPFFVRKLTKRWLMAATLLIIALVPIVRAISFKPETRTEVHSYTWIVADCFAFGALLALFVRKEGFSRRQLVWGSAGALSLGAAILAAGAPYGILSRQTLLGSTFELTAANMVFAGVIGATLLLATSGWSFLVRIPVLEFYGDISYGFYLVHWLVFLWYDALAKTYFPGYAATSGHFWLIMMRFAVASAVATLLATISRHYIEEPFMRLKDRFTAAKRPVVSGALPSMTAIRAED